MSVFTKFPVRVTIPVVLLLLALLIEGFTLKHNQRQADSDEENEAMAQLTEVIGELQNSVNYRFGRGDLSGVQSVIASRSSSRYVALIVAVDDTGTIIGSTDLKLVGQSASEGVPDWDVGLMKEADATLASRVSLSRDRSLITAYAPITLGAKAGELRPNRVGIIRLTYDLTLAKAVRRYALQRQAFVAGGFYIGCFLLLGIFFQVVFTRRVGQLVDATKRFAGGDFSAAAGLTGEDELAQVGTAFDRMVRTIAQNQRSLSGSEQKYRTLIQKIPAAVVVHGPRTEILTSNLSAQMLLGLTEDQLLGRAATDPTWYFLRQDGSRLPLAEYPVNSVMMSRKPLRDAVLGVHRPAGNGPVWLLVNADPVFGEDSSIAQVIVSFVDITERKRSEEALQKSAQEVQDLYDNAPCGYHSLDAEGMFVRINNTELSWLGYAREELLGKKTFADLLTPSSRMDFQREFPLFKQRGWVHDLNFEMVRKDGTVLPVLLNATAIKDADGHFLVSRSAVVDVTERRQNERFNAARMHLVQYSLTHSTDELLEETINEAEKLTGSLIGFYHFVDEDQKSLTLQNWSTRTKSEFCQAAGKGAHYPVKDAGVWADCVREHRAIIHNDYASLANRKGLPAGHAEVTRELVVPVFRGRNVTAILGVGNKPVDYTEKDVETVSLFADLAWEIAERKRAEEELHKLNAELEDRVRKRTAHLEAALKELESISYSVSHDLRTPLRSIEGFSKLLLKDYDRALDEEGKQNLQSVRAASQRLAELTDGLLMLIKVIRSELHRVPVDLSALARVVVHELQHNEPGRSVEWVIATGLVVHADAHHMRTVMENLLGNAWKFTGKQPAARIEFGHISREGVPTYFVRDNGVGFEMAHAQKLFGEFRRLHAATEYPGTGVGLAIVRRIIDRHGGRIWAESAPGRGATFYFTLPS